MGALSKFFLSPIYRLISAYFSDILPQVFRFIIISIFVLYHSYQRENCKHEYMALINTNSTRFSFRRKKSCPEDPETTSCDSSECSICLADYEEGDSVRRLRCDHTFHGKCLDTWFHRSQATCPLCRTFVVPEKVAEERRRKEDEHLMVNKGLEEELAMMLLSSRNFWSYHSGTSASCN